MSDSRRYDEDEIAEILELATSTQESAGPPARGGSGEGLTLEQIQAIGSEVGIAPDRIATAVQTMEGRKLVGPQMTFLGAPRSVSRIVSIDRPLTDHEWSRLVADVRQTFNAAGRVTTAGDLRTWTNGNLHVYVEPDGDGYRVRMRTFKGNVWPRMGASAAFLFLSVILMIEVLAEGTDIGAMVMSAVFAAAAVGNAVITRGSLPGWATERAAQMEGLAERIPLLLEE